MSFRGPAITYIIRKTTTNNATGDSFAITIPRFIAEQFSGCHFTMVISGNSIIFTSGCKLTQNDIPQNYNISTKIYFGDAPVRFN